MLYGGNMRSIRSVYSLAKDLRRMSAFYEKALGLELAFRDGDRWAQFKAGSAVFALSSPDEAAPGATGSVIVFDAVDLETVAQQVDRFGGQLVAVRDMGAHGSVATLLDPESNFFQLHVRHDRLSGR
ncbi:VOC family protein [Bradyrhizobium diazoefficiens]|uniref:VOC family protein n=2 Tax=Bradyrhizobium TaxID=374 RepID=UPI000D72FBE8